MKTLSLFLLSIFIISLSGCSATFAPRGWKYQVKHKQNKPLKKVHKLEIKNPHKKQNKKIKRKHLESTCIVGSPSYTLFKKNTNLRKSYKVYKNQKLLNQSTKRNTKVKIDVSEQRVRLYVNNKVAIDAPCTTGAKHKFEPNTKIYRDKRTPLGTFKVLEKIQNKRSTIFGDYYRGKKRVYHGDRNKFKGSKKGLRYEGASLKNWMRLTGGGIGLHASKYVKRYPGTNGCIRLPYGVSRMMYRYVHKGTPVSVVN